MTSNGLSRTTVKILSNFMSTMQNYCGPSCATDSWKWDVSLFTSVQRKTAVKYAVLVLNRPVEQGPSFIKPFWNNATLRMTIDGGTVQWDKYINKLPEDVRKTMKVPDLITGDFDSITQDVLEQYRKKGCKTIQTPDQDYTDFTKALMELNSHCQRVGKKIDHVFALAQTSGRIDQVLGNIQTLFLVKEKQLLLPETTVYLMSDDAISWLLKPGEHTIDVPEETRKHKRAWCSLIPVGEPCESVTSTGLKWNLDNQPLKFGDVVSTSNTFAGTKEVTIKCSHTILWSMRIPCVMS